MSSPVPSDGRRVLVAVAGPNGAGKSTFYHAHLRHTGWRFVNADVLARELGLDPYDAAKVADALRQQLVLQRESFVFETVFSDPAGAKLEFLKEAVQAGYRVILCFIGLGSPEASEERVAMRVSQGGHDVPTEKLVARYPRTMANLKTALTELPEILIFDNEDLRTPFRFVAAVENGRCRRLNPPVPAWLASLLPSRGNDSA